MIEKSFQSNRKKCHNAKSEITWLGYNIKQSGIRLTATKTDAIEAIRSHPKTYEQFIPFLGKVHHITKCVPNPAQLCHNFWDILKNAEKLI